MPKGQICILFKEVPAGTHFIKNNYSWVNESEGKKYVDQGFGVIYDPSEKKEIKPKSEKPTTDIPDDFPGRNHLIDAGICFMKEVSKIKDFDEIPGIGQSIEQKIVNYFAEPKNKL